MDPCKSGATADGVGLNHDRHDRACAIFDKVINAGGLFATAFSSSIEDGNFRMTYCLSNSDWHLVTL